MLRSRLLGWLKASGPPWLWIVIARACWLARAAGLDRRRWTALMAYALKRAEVKPSGASVRGARADALVKQGDLRGAIDLYEAAINDAMNSDGRWAFNAIQRWQFDIERTYHLLGHARVRDPLFAAAVTPAKLHSDRHQQVAGHFDARIACMGLAINGFLESGMSESVSIILNGVLLRSVTLIRKRSLSPFNLTVTRKSLDLFPQDGRLEVLTAEGDRLYGPVGAEYLELSMPHGSGRIVEIIDDGGNLNKKGEIRASAVETKHRQDRDLEIYSKLKEFFANHLGRSVFLLHGTLLGYYRDGDLIPGDDDFDAGYVSDKSDPEAVKAEAMDIIVELVRAGFIVSFNRRGRLFRVQLDRNATDGCHVDIHPIWFQDGNVWIHNVISFPSKREDFLPVEHGLLRGTAVSIPQNTEAFLLGNYGSGWNVPDPGFRYHESDVDPGVRANLARAMITVREYRQLAERIRHEVGDAPAAGRLVSIGLQSLYPLEEFIA